MIRHIPPKEYPRWGGVTDGMFFGTIRKTFSLDLDRFEGVAMISPKMERIEDSTELADLSGDSNRIVNFIRTDADCTDRYWALSGSALYKTDSAAAPDPADDWDTDGLDSSPTNGMHDFAVHGNDSRADSGRNKLFVTLDSDIAVLNDTGNNQWTGGWWVTKHGQAGLDTNFPHPIEFFVNRKITMVGDGHKLHTISRPSDTQNDTVTNSRLLLSRNLAITSIACTAERAWLGCFHRRQGRGAIVEWDGFSQSANKTHEINGLGVLAIVNYGSSPIALENTGQFLEYNGNGFVPMIRNGNIISLTSKEDPGSSLTNGSTINSTAAGSVHFRGMTAGEDGLIYINFAGMFNGGYGRSRERMTGIWCLNPITGRLYNKYAFSERDDSTDAGHQGMPIPAQNHPGGLFWVTNDNLLLGRNLLAGGVLYTTDSTPTGGIWLLEDYYNGVGPNLGYFVTQFLPAEEVEDKWDILWLKLFRRHESGSGNSVTVKARGMQHQYNDDLGPLEKAITWTAATTFTVSTNSNLQVGDEVEVIFGENSGTIAHITNINGTTITIDESVGQTSGTAVARFERWKKLGVFTDTTIRTQKFNIGIDSPFIQFKVVLKAPDGPFFLNQAGVSGLVVKSSPAINL